MNPPLHRDLNPLLPGDVEIWRRLVGLEAGFADGREIDSVVEIPTRGRRVRRVLIRRRQSGVQHYEREIAASLEDSLLATTGEALMGIGARIRACPQV